jgi:hypothetical protein
MTENILLRPKLESISKDLYYNIYKLQQLSNLHSSVEIKIATIWSKLIEQQTKLQEIIQEI